MSARFVDIAVIVVYVLPLVALAVWGRTRSDDDYLLASRKLGSLRTLATINATKTGAIFVLFTAMVYQYGFSAVWYFLATSVGFVVFIPFAHRVRRRSKGRFLTLADYLVDGYGAPVGRAAALPSLTLEFGLLVINLIASAKVLGFFTGIPFVPCVLIIAALITPYLVRCGYRGVVLTDVIQYVALLACMVLIGVMLFTELRFPTEHVRLDELAAGDFAGFVFIGLFIPFGAPDMWQRVYSAGSPKALTRGFLGSVVAYLVFGVLLTCAAIAIKVALPDLDPDLALLVGIVRVMPTGMIGVCIVLFGAAFMSTIDTVAFATGTACVRDLLGEQDPSKVVRKTRRALPVVMAAATVLAIVIEDLVQGGLMAAGYAIVTAIPVLLTWMRPSVRPSTLRFGLFGGWGAVTLTVVAEATTGSLSPRIIVVALGVTLLGLLVGAIASRVRSATSRT